MQVRVLTRDLVIADQEVSVKRFEAEVFTAVREFVNAAWQAFVWEVERWAASQHPAGSLRVKGKEQRRLLTTSGPVTFTRRRFTSPAEEHSFMLFDKRVDLASNRRSTAAAERLLAEMGAEGPYAPAARSLERLWGQRVNAMRVWTAVQRVGRVLEEKRKALRNSVFEEYVGISYTGKEARKGRFRLIDKGICYGLEGSAKFGKDFFAMVQERHNVVDVRHGTYLSDGAEALRNIQREHFPRHTRGMDWRHIRAKMEETYRVLPGERHKELLKELYAEKLKEVCQQIQADAEKFPARSERLQELRTYIENAGDDLYAIRKLRRAGVALPPRLQGSGGAERNEDILVGQRMKRRGMSWTNPGAGHLLAVRFDLFLTLRRISPRRS